LPICRRARSAPSCSHSSSSALTPTAIRSRAQHAGLSAGAVRDFDLAGHSRFRHGAIIEVSLNRGLIIDGGDIWAIATRPIAAGLLIVAGVTAILSYRFGDLFRTAVTAERDHLIEELRAIAANDLRQAGFDVMLK
jgi:hypothetical protein